MIWATAVACLLSARSAERREGRRPKPARQVVHEVNQYERSAGRTCSRPRGGGRTTSTTRRRSWRYTSQRRRQSGRSAGGGSRNGPEGGSCGTPRPPTTSTATCWTIPMTKSAPRSTVELWPLHTTTSRGSVGTRPTCAHTHASSSQQVARAHSLFLPSQGGKITSS